MSSFHRGKFAGFPGDSNSGFFPQSPTQGGFFGSDTGGGAANSNPTADFTSSVNFLDVTFTDTSTDSDGTVTAWDWDFGDGTAHGTTQNPVHTYTTTGSKNVTLTVTDNAAGISNPTTHAAVPVIHTDGPAPAKQRPATTAEWTALGLPIPTEFWLCQEASGNLAGVRAALTLTAANSPTYQTAVTNWTNKAVTLAQTSSQRFAMAAGTGPNPASTSVTWLVYAKLNTISANARVLVGANVTGTAPYYLRFNTTGLAALNCNGTVGTLGGTNYLDSLVHPFLLKYDRTNSVAACYTNTETLTVTYSSSVQDQVKGLGGSGNTPPAADIVYAAVWSGADAEGLSAATLTTLGW